MPGTFVVNYTDPQKPPITIPPMSTDNSTSIQMVGYRYPVYGEKIWENFLRLTENFAYIQPPQHPITGQMWVDTSSTPPLPKIYDQQTDSWSPIGNEVTIGLNPPAVTHGIWFNPSTKALSYWDGTTWVNMLCMVIASIADYNDVVQDVNTLLVKYGQPLMVTRTAATLAQWDDLVAKIKQLAEYRQIPAHITNRLVSVQTFDWCTHSTASVFTSLKKFDVLLRALDQIAVSDEVDATCLEVNSPASGIKTRPAPWSVVTHLGTFAHASDTHEDVFFQTGGKYVWEGAVAGMALDPLAQEWQAFLQEVGDVDVSWAHTSNNGAPTGPGVRDLTTTDKLLFYKSVTTTKYYTAYYSIHNNPNIIGALVPTLKITGRKTSAGTVVITVEFSSPQTSTGTLSSSFSMVRVSQPCLDVPPPWPLLTSSGTI